jgi:hypothetical protein
MPSRSPQGSQSVTEHEIEDVTAQIEAELAHLQVSDVLLHTASTVASLAYRVLREEDRELRQVRLAIDSLQALLPLLESSLPAELRGDFRRVIGDLQFAYAEATRN